MTPSVEESEQSAGRAPTISVLDDDDGIRRSLTTLLQTLGYRTAVFASPVEFLAGFHADMPGCLVSDIRMPEISGLELQQKLNSQGVILPIIFMSGHADVLMAVQAMKAGAFEFLQKPFRDQDLLDAISRALKFDADNRRSFAQHGDVLRRLATLTPRERQVKDMVVEGAANKVIAMDLHLSERTVEIHRAKVMEKMAASSLAHLVKMHLTAKGDHSSSRTG